MYIFNSKQCTAYNKKTILYAELLIFDTAISEKKFRSHLIAKFCNKEKLNSIFENKSAKTIYV